MSKVGYPRAKDYKYLGIFIFICYTNSHTSTVNIELNPPRPKLQLTFDTKLNDF